MKTHIFNNIFSQELTSRPSIERNIKSKSKHTEKGRRFLDLSYFEEAS
jgi:hypothetical protein